MPDYQKGKIYKLWSPQGNEIYIGSTVNSLAKRLGQHNSSRACSSKYLFENYDVVKIELIEEYPCNNKMELAKKEGEHIRSNKCLNRCIAGRPQKEYQKEYNKKWYENNKEHRQEYFKKWSQDNKEHREEYSKKWHENNKEHEQEYRAANKEHIQEYLKKYNENNKERIKKYKKEYNENNKEKLNEKFNCECGGKYIQGNKERHFKTEKHKKFTKMHQ